jgi:hypothetical protein
MSDLPTDSIRYFNLKYRLNYNYEVIAEGKEEPELFSTRGQIVKQYGISLQHPTCDEGVAFQRSKEVVAPQD